ncbi:hypothetical protein AB6817_10140, partial [Carnobacterium maltaromaticum]
MAINEMMDRPVVNKDVLEFIRKKQKPLAGKLGEIERGANEREVLGPGLFPRTKPEHMPGTRLYIT